METSDVHKDDFSAVPTERRPRLTEVSQRGKGKTEKGLVYEADMATKEYKENLQRLNNELKEAESSSDDIEVKQRRRDRLQISLNRFSNAYFRVAKAGHVEQHILDNIGCWSSLHPTQARSGPCQARK